MTPDEARRILNLPPGFPAQEVDQAFALNRTKYTAQSNLATDPVKRDQAQRALALGQEAYRVLTNREVPDRISPNGYPKRGKRAIIPTARLGREGSQKRSTTPIWPPTPFARQPGRREQFVAAMICLAFVTLGILLLIRA